MFMKKTCEAYYNMHKRCSGFDNYHKSRYTDRGITVCDDWSGEEGLKNFREWCKGRWQEGLTLDRIDNNAGYSPENCRWTSFEQQARNRSNSVLFEGIPLIIWSSFYGINYKTLWAAFKKQMITGDYLHKYVARNTGVLRQEKIESYACI